MVMKKLKEDVYAMGTMEIVDVRETNNKMQEYCAFTGGCGSIRTFYRVRLGEEVFCSAKYTHVKKRNSYTILYNKGVFRFGLIVQYFCIKWDPIALVQKLRVTARFKEDIPIFSVRKLDEYDVINVCDIQEKCMYVEVDSNNVYVCRFPCKILTD